MLVKRFLGIILGIVKNTERSRKSTRVCRRAAGTVNFWESVADQKNRDGNVFMGA